MANEKVIEFETDKGIIQLSVAIVGEITEEGAKEDDPNAEPSGYRNCVLECQRILDELKIPPAKGQTCSDPTCKSRLGHRLRELRNRYVAQAALLRAIRESPQLAADLVNGKSRAH